MALEICEKTTEVLPPGAGGKTGVQPCSPGKALLDCDVNEALSDGQNQTFPGPLMCNKTNKEDVIRFIQGKSEECWRHADKPERRDSYLFWKVMELFCKQNGKAKMSKVATVLFREYGCLRDKACKLESDQEHNWCLFLASLLCNRMPKDEHIKAVIDMGDNLATKGLTLAAHICYVVAYKELDFGLIGCESVPDEVSAMNEAIERTEVYEYVLGLTSGCAQPNVQEYKFLYACKLFESGLSAQALDYCETIARAVATVPDRFPNTLLDQLIQLSEKLNEGKGEEPEWLLNLRLLNGEEAGLSNSCTEQKQHDETPHPPKVANTPESYRSRAREFRGFNHLTEELTSLYTIGELLGYGGEGVVYAGVHIADGREVAIKFSVLDDDLGMMTIPGETTPVPSEVGLMQMVSKPFRSPYVLELLEWFMIPHYTVMILEKVSPCMDLLEFCEFHGGKLPEPLARDIMVQVVCAAHHCYDCGVFHSDIKPGNILINTQTLQIKLIDFGCGDLVEDAPYTRCPGTWEYFPPEWCGDRQYSARPATVWFLGVILFQMLCGDIPFHTCKEIAAANLNLPPGLSKDCCDLISWCLVREPKSRPNFRQIFKHRWLMGGPSYIQNIPVIGGLSTRLIQFLDYYRD